MKSKQVLVLALAIAMIATVFSPAVSAAGESKGLDLNASVKEPKPEIAITVDVDHISFGELLPGETSASYPVSVTNIGLKALDVTADVEDDGPEAIFAEGITVNGDAWGNYSSQLVSDGSDSFDIALHIPETAVTRGDISGSLTVWAEAIETPVANFSASPLSGDAPLAVHFTDLSASSPTSWYWEFGDGGTSTEQNPSYTYNTPGNYTVKLIVSNGMGSATLVLADYIHVFEASTSSDWTSFQGNLYNSGVTNSSGPTLLHVSAAWISEQMSTFSGGIDAAPIVVDGKVFVIDLNGYVYAYRVSDGAKLWENKSLGLGGSGFQMSTPAYNNDVLYVAIIHGPGQGVSVYALDAENGHPLWERVQIFKGYAQPNTPIVYDDGRIYFGVWNGNPNQYTCLYANNGTTAWQYTSSTGSGYYWAGAAVIGDFIVFGNDAGIITSLNKLTGDKVQDISVSAAFGITNSEIRSSVSYSEETNRIYFTVKGGYCLALGFNADGTFNTTDKWAAWIGQSTSTPAVYNGRVYVGIGDFSENNGNTLYCLYESNGTEIWSFAANGGIQASPVVSTCNDDGDGEVYLYFTTNAANGRAYCVDGNGQLKWYYQPDADHVQQILQGVALYDGKAIFGNDAGYLFALVNDPVVYNGTVELTPGTTFEVRSIENRTYAGLGTVTDLGALYATGLDFRVSDRSYPPVFSLESIGRIANAPDRSYSWAVFINDQIAAGGLYGNVLVNGDHVKFYYLPYDADNHPLVDRALYLVSIDVAVNAMPLPTAAFSISVSSGVAPLVVQFTDQSVIAASWQWDFGDQTTSTERNPSHTYTVPGTYTVTLIVSNDVGSDTATGTVIVIDPSSPAIQYAFASIGGSITITGYMGPGGEVVIPGEINSQLVTVIGATAFKDNKNVTSITIPDSVTTIGSGAFSKCTALTSVTIGNGVITIEDRVFYGCSALISVMIPDSITELGYGAFYQCTALTSVAIGNGVTTIGYMTFYGCTALTSVTIGSSINKLDEYAFGPCAALINITFKGNAPTDVHQFWSLGSLQLKVYYYMGATGFTNPWNGVACYPLPSSAAFSADETSGDVPLAVHFTDLSTSSPTSWYWEFGDGGTSTLQHPTHTYNAPGNYTVKLTVSNGTGSATLVLADYIHVLEPTVEPNDYQYTDSGDSITIDKYIGPGGKVIIPGEINGKPVTRIGNESFTRASVTSVIIPDSVISIGRDAFSHCTALTSVTIGSGVTTIGYDAFAYCTGLTSVTIPDSVTIIDTFAFYCCKDLTSVTIGSGVTTIGYDAFGSCTGLTSVTIGSGVTTIGERAFMKCTALTSIIIPDSVTTITKQAFSGCTALTSVAIGNSVTTIGESAFGSCTGLTSITIPDSVITIGWSAFYQCTALTSVTIGNGVTTIGNYAFQKCKVLTSVTIGSNVTTISNNAFGGCTALTSIIIPDSVITIDSFAFDSCSNLTSATIGNGVTTIGGFAFEKCTALTSIIIPDSVTTIGSNAFRECTALTSVAIGNGVTTIGTSAFSGCTALISVTIPDSVITIDSFAFMGCTNLTSVTIGNGVTTIGDYVFSGLTALTNITFEGNAPTKVSNSWANRCTNLVVYYYEGATGFTTPKWNGVPCQALPAPAAESWELFQGNQQLNGYYVGNAPDSDDLKWVSAAIDAWPSSSVVIAEGKVFVYCYNETEEKAYIAALYVENGTLAWMEPMLTNPLWDPWATPAYHDGLVFTAGIDGRIYAYGPAA